MFRSDRTQNGFTLLEVLVAILVAAIVLVGTSRIVGSAARTQHAINERVVAGWIASDHLARIQLGLHPAEVGESSGETSMASRVWRWRWYVQPTADQGLNRTTVSVAPSSDAGFIVTYKAFVSATGDH